jgi:hypothetical protein
VNGNGDSAGDRVLINPAGIGGTSTTSLPTCLLAGVATVGAGCTSANTVAYTARSATAQFIRPGNGALEPNNGLVVAGRNTILMRPINNIDLTLGKKFAITEKLRLEFQGQFQNFFNHPQYIGGSINTVTLNGGAVSYSDGSAGGLAVKSSLTPGNANFGRYDQVLSSQPRVIQLVAKLVF